MIDIDIDVESSNGYQVVLIFIILRTDGRKKKIEMEWESMFLLDDIFLNTFTFL